MPRGFPSPLEPANIRQVIKRMRRRHVAADDPRRDEFPDPEAEEALFQTVLFTRRRFRAVPRRDRADHVRDRLTLIRHGHRLLEAETLEAIKDGRAAGMTWRQIGKPLGIETKNGVVQRMQRLQVLIELGDRVPRHPRTLRTHQLDQATSEQRLAIWVARHSREVYATAQELVEHRDCFVHDDDVDEWLDDLEWLLNQREDTEVRESVASHLYFAVEEIDGLAERSGRSPAAGEPAFEVLERARALATRFHRRQM